jgi:hypothetical protein
MRDKLLQKLQRETRNGEAQCNQGEDQGSFTGTPTAPQIVMAKRIRPVLLRIPLRDSLKEVWTLTLLVNL